MEASAIDDDDDDDDFLAFVGVGSRVPFFLFCFCVRWFCFCLRSLVVLEDNDQGSSRRRAAFRAVVVDVDVDVDVVLAILVALLALPFIEYVL